MSEPGQGSDLELRRLVFHSLLTGLTPLIPIPFVDDEVHDFFRRRMLAEMARRHHSPLGERQITTLGVGPAVPSEPRGCLRGCFGIAFVKPLVYLLRRLIRKVVHKLLIFLALKDCVDAFSRTFHEGYLAQHALRRGLRHSPEGGVADGDVVAVRQAIEDVTHEVDPRPVEKLVRNAFRGSRQRLVRAARRLSASVRRPADAGATPVEQPRAVEEDEEQLLADLTRELTADLGGKSGYLQQLERRFDARHAELQERGQA